METEDYYGMATEPAMDMDTGITYSSDVVPEGSIPQSEPLDSAQQVNNAGGYSYVVSDMNRLKRFLCFGSEGGTYYAKEKELGIDNALCVMRLIESGKGTDVVKEVVAFSVEGRTAKQNPILFTLAMCARQDKDPAVKKLAYEKLADVCRIPTHLFTFVGYAEKLSKGTGWGRAHRRAIANWYLRFADKPLKLAQHVTKYRNRNGWEHKDILRLSHPKTADVGISAILKYIIKGLNVAKLAYLNDDSDDNIKKLFAFLSAVDEIRTITEPSAALHLIEQHRLVWEHLPTQLLKEIDIWRSLLQNMPMTAMMRNLNKMTANGLLAVDTDESRMVVQKLTNPENLKAARIHPFNVLVALKTYSNGKGDKGKLTWDPNPQIVDALDDAFYKAFKFVEPTNQRYLLAVDISSSMGCYSCIGSALSPRDAAAAMTMVTARTEANYDVVGFSTHLIPLRINPGMKMPEVLEVMQSHPFGGTDCAQPMIWAKQNDKLYDTFIVYTDSETRAGYIHPTAAIQDYRRHSGIWNAKLIVCGMTANEFTLADPNDPGMLDIAGFDSNAPDIMRSFSLGLF